MDGLPAKTTLLFNRYLKITKVMAGNIKAASKPVKILFFFSIASKIGMYMIFCVVL
jgi:hypothetical protein